MSTRIVVRRQGFVLDVDLDLVPGEVLAVLGPNGAGKSTLLEALAGLVPVADGRRPPLRAGLVFQDHRLFPHLTAHANVAFGPRAQGCGRREAGVRADAWLARLEVSHLGQVRPGQLSGGQAQRVALARTLCAEPELLLLDEPMAALDAQARGQTRRFLRAELAAFPGPAVLVTHDAVEALSLADRLAVLDGGRVVQVGSPGAVASRPANAYIASLVGLTLLRGVATDGVVDLADGGRLHTAQPSLVGAVLVAVRPSSVLLSRAEPVGTSARNTWPGEVAGLETTGDRVRVRVTGPPDLLVDVTLSAVAELRLGVGDRVWSSVKATDVDVWLQA